MLKNQIYYINGKWVVADEALIPFNDAGFLYGDGLFETLRFDNKKIFSADFDSHRKPLTVHAKYSVRKDSHK